LFQLVASTQDKKMRMIFPVLPFMAVMAAVVVASNYLVQFPVNYTIGALNLADLLTWGAFTYPVAFLVTDLANRRFGPQSARLSSSSALLSPWRCRSGWHHHGSRLPPVQPF
jgi:uncharacterized PurR-regulated membrane protein YhhQ (DUF165 family)